MGKIRLRIISLQGETKTKRPLPRVEPLTEGPVFRSQATKTRQRRGYKNKTNEELLELAKDYSSRSECCSRKRGLHRELKRRNLLARAYGVKKQKGRKRIYGHLSDSELIALAHPYGSRRECFIGNSTLYTELNRKDRNLLQKAFGDKQKRGVKVSFVEVKATDGRPLEKFTEAELRGLARMIKAEKKKTN